MKPNKPEIGQRWIMGPYANDEKYLIAEVVKLLDKNFIQMKVIQHFSLSAFWRIDSTMKENIMTLTYWNYLEGQDKIV